MPKALRKRPQSPGSTAVLTNYHYYNSAIVTRRLNRGQWTSVWQAKKDFDMTHACNRQVAFWLHSEHHCRSLNWPAINPCKTLRELKTSAGRSLVRHEPCSREVKLRRHCWNWHSRPANPAVPPHEQDKRYQEHVSFQACPSRDSTFCLCEVESHGKSSKQRKANVV